MPRSRKYRPAEERAIAAAIVAARAAKTPWKTLCEQYGLGRTKLWELAKDLTLAAPPENVREHISAGQA